MSLLRNLFSCPKSPSGAQANVPAALQKNTNSEKNGAETSRVSSEAECSQQLDRECAVCQDQLTEPCTLPCGNHHVFCLACLKGLTTHSPHRHHVLCPLCRKRVRVPIGGVAAFLNHKSLAQKLRSKLPELRRQRRRHGSRRRREGGRRSRDLVTVSFPVFGYSENLELDILTSLYAQREGSDRLLEAILEQINGRPVQHHHDQNGGGGVWLSEEPHHDHSNQEGEEVVDAESPPGALAGTPQLSGEVVSLLNTEDLDMSVVLQIIADMEENDRLREAGHQDTGDGEAAGWAPSRRSTACSQEIDNDELQKAADGDSSQTAVASNTSQRLDASSIVPQKLETGNGAGQQSVNNDARPQRPEHGSDALQQQEANSTTVQKPETNDTGTSRRCESSNSTLPERKTGHAKTRQPKSRKPASQRSRFTSAASEQSDAGEAASLKRSEGHSTASPQSSKEEASVPDSSCSSHSGRLSGVHERTERPKNSKVTSQKTDRSSVAPRSTPPQYPPRRSPAGNSLKESAHAPGESDAVAGRKEAGLCDVNFFPRPRMGSFRLAIAAGQRSPSPDVDNPSLFPLTPLQCQDSETERDDTRDTVDVHSAVHRSIPSHSRHKMKTEIGEHPLKVKYHPQQVTNANPSSASEQSHFKQLARTMDTPGRENKDQVIAVMDRAERPNAREKQRMYTSSQNAAAMSSHEKRQHRDMKLQDLWSEEDTTSARPTNEELPTPGRSQTSEGIFQNFLSDPQLQALRSRDGGRTHDSNGQVLPSTTSPGFPSHQRKRQEIHKKPRRSTTPSVRELQEKTTSNRRTTLDKGDRQDSAHPGSNCPASSTKDADDSEEWTRRIRGLQRRVISQTWNQAACRDVSARAAGAEGPVVSSSSRHSWATSSTPSARATDGGVVLKEPHNDSVDVFLV